MSESNKELMFSINSILQDSEATQIYFEVRKYNPKTAGWRRVGRIDGFKDINLKDEIEEKFGDGKYKLTIYDQEDQKLNFIGNIKIKPVVIQVGDEEEDQIEEQKKDEEMNITQSKDAYKNEDPINRLKRLTEEQITEEIKHLDLMTVKKRLADTVYGPQEEKNKELMLKLERAERKAQERGEKNLKDVTETLYKQSTESQKAIERMYEKQREEEREKERLRIQMEKERKEEDRKRQEEQSNMTMAFFNQMNDKSKSENNTMMQMMFMMQQESKQQQERQNEIMRMQQEERERRQEERDRQQKEYMMQMMAMFQHEKKPDPMLPVLLEMIRESKRENPIVEIMKMPQVAGIIQNALERKETPIDKALPIVIGNVSGAMTKMTEKMAESLLQDKPEGDPLVQKMNNYMYMLRNLTPELVQVITAMKTPISKPKDNISILKEKNQTKINKQDKPKQNLNEYAINQNISPITKINKQPNIEDIKNFDLSQIPPETIAFFNELDRLPTKSAIEKLNEEMPHIVKMLKTNDEIANQVAATGNIKLQEIIREIRSENE